MDPFLQWPSQHVAFPHASLHTEEPRRESSVAGNIFLSEARRSWGARQAPFWQTHCLKRQEISWATVAVRHWYDFCWIYSSAAERKPSDSGSLRPLEGRCVYSSWGVYAGGNGWKPLQCCWRWAEDGNWGWAFRHCSHSKAISFYKGSHHLQKAAVGML